MTLVFTICSVNYLAQAHTLGESLLAHNPDVKFIVGLVDKCSTKNIDTTKLPPFELLEVDKINIPDFEAMCARYDITELNTAVKPFYFSYFFEQYSHSQFIYLDPDIIVYRPLTALIKNLTKYNFIVTPHICTPIADSYHPSEATHCNTGIYNFGFVAFQRSTEATDFVKWWEAKLTYECKIDLCNGLFVDQHWGNFIPNFSDNVLIEKHLGYNTAYWNFHERVLSQQNGEWFVNGDVPLYFLHYSGYSPQREGVVSKYENRFDFKQRPDLWPIFEYYKNKLYSHNQNYWENFACDYIKPKPVERLVRVRKYARWPFEKLAAWIG
jgi:lipopolysaccharide biosynthesis glycosyltransferase